LAVQDRLVPLHDAVFKEPGVSGAKFGLSLLGRVSTEVRLPLLPVGPATQSAIRAAMIHADLIRA
jgi:4-hydroxy-tetrahydrodipicolinate synthase